jgi:hypothetical protein
MEVTDSQFYHVEVNGDESVFQSQQEALDYLRESQDSIEASSSDVQLFSVETGEEWSIKEVPWQNIALQLL